MLEALLSTKPWWIHFLIHSLQTRRINSTRMEPCCKLQPLHDHSQCVYQWPQTDHFVRKAMMEAGVHEGYEENSVCVLFNCV